MSVAGGSASGGPLVVLEVGRLFGLHGLNRLVVEHEYSAQRRVALRQRTQSLDHRRPVDLSDKRRMRLQPICQACLIDQLCDQIAR
jgi:hypothetical protein